jgi:N-acetylneuraminic acid mutarotase
LIKKLLKEKKSCWNNFEIHGASPFLRNSKSKVIERKNGAEITLIHGASPFLRNSGTKVIERKK